MICFECGTEFDMSIFLLLCVQNIWFIFYKPLTGTQIYEEIKIKVCLSKQMFTWNDNSISYVRLHGDRSFIN